MRYDKPATFVEITRGEYNPEQGKRNPDDLVITKKLVAAYDLQNQETLQTYGKEYRRGLVIHHLGKVVTADVVELKNKQYKILSSRQVRRKASYLLGEIKNENNI